MRLLGVWGVVGLVALMAVWPALAAPAAGGGAAPEPSQAGRGASEPGGQLQLTVATVGLGGQVRRGSWAGVRVEFLDRAAVGRDIVLVLTLRDIDGDRLSVERSVLTSPNQRLSAWLYAPVPFAVADSTALVDVSAYEAGQGAGGLGGGSAVGRGRLLGQASVRLFQREMPVSVGAIAVVGRNAVGLEPYALRENTVSPIAPLAHEPVDLLSGLRPGDLPDRWMGYGAVTEIVWTASRTEGEPADMSVAQAEALRAWVEQGGHMVVVLPAVGQLWTSRSNLLLDIMPRVEPQRLDRYDVRQIGAILRHDAPLFGTTVSRSVGVPTQSAAVQALPDAPGVLPGQNTVILADPSGVPLVVRRQVGVGAVTLVGIDLTNPAILPAVQARTFWNRVLGRRGAYMPEQEWAQVKSQLQLGTGPRREQVNLDEGVLEAINQRGQAGAGILISLVVFGVYWFLAGPVMQRALRARGLGQHSWVAFVGSVAVFAALAWGGAVAVRSAGVPAQHLTVYDSVHGQAVDRARVWASVLLPGYGETVVSARDTEQRPQAGAVSPWDSPDGSAGSAFLDSQRYSLDSRRPDAVAFPSRNTVKSVRVDWSGAPVWRGPIPVAGPDGQPGQLRAVRGTGRLEVRGGLRHELPSALRDVTVIVIGQQSALGRPSTGQLLAQGVAMSMASWEPGQVLDMGQLSGSAAGESRRGRDLSSFLENLLPRARGFGGIFVPGAAQRQLASDRMRALSFFGLLPPPDVQSPNNASTQARRRLFHGLDLSRWSTQPCVIVMGTVSGEPSPVPVTVGGTPMGGQGLTFYRWVYPLANDPPQYAAP